MMLFLRNNTKYLNTYIFIFKVARWHIGKLSVSGPEGFQFKPQKRLKIIKSEIITDIWDSKYTLFNMMNNLSY